MDRPTNSKTTNSLLHNLYVKPTKDKGVNKPTYPDFVDNYFHQADLLHLPDDDGYKYALVVSDVGSRLTDARPLKSKNPAEVLIALKKIYSGKILKPPTHTFGVDGGTEFQGAVKLYLVNHLNVHIKIAKPDRHQQQAIVERKNRDIGKKLFMRMTAEELQTGHVSKAWVDNLPEVIQEINDHTKKTRVRKINNKPEDLEYQCSGDACNIIEQGTKVRAMLDAPRNVHDNKKLSGKFRETDIRFAVKPRTVMVTLLAPGNPPMYLLDTPDGKVDRQVAYTKNQLQIIPKNEQKPTEKDIKGQKENGVTKWVVEKLVDRKKVGNKIMFTVKWKGFDKTTQEPRSSLIKDIPQLIHDFENHEKNNK